MWFVFFVALRHMCNVLTLFLRPLYYNLNTFCECTRTTASHDVNALLKIEYAENGMEKVNHCF